MDPLLALFPLENHPLTSPSSTGLYLHIPFCAVKCRFCDFAAYPGRRADVPRYLAALQREMRSIMGRPTLDTLYVGGGTPSLLDPLEWTNLVQAVNSHFELASGAEVTMECNPDGVSPEKWVAWSASGVNRISLGLQTDEPGLLALLGRTHTWDDFENAFKTARRQKIHALNVDLMFGLPGQTVSGWVSTLRRVADLGPDHISTYGLQVEEHTYFHRSGVQADDDRQADMYETAADLLESAGYVHYEISNFARPGFECRHNLRYWRNQDCLGLGVSAAGYDGARRKTNTDDLTAYMTSVETRGVSDHETVELSPAQRVGENLMLALRLKEGVVPTSRGLALYGEPLDRHVRGGLLVRDGARYRPTRTGWRLSNRLFVDLLGPE
ncbi:MAG: radical SAM family heme chaperone HemW [Elusimicrobia bacterium]|nr:radical SAM family heme chaperone HemW [Elusimicrobiota bacterium]